MTFQIGDKVITKKLGVPVVGRVVQITNAEYYFVLNRDNPYTAEAYNKYKEYYPHMKNVCVVLMDQPVRMSPISHFQDSNPLMAQMSFMTQQVATSAIYPDVELEFFDGYSEQEEKEFNKLKIETSSCGVESIQEESCPSEQETLLPKEESE